MPRKILLGYLTALRSEGNQPPLLLGTRLRGPYSPLNAEENTEISCFCQESKSDSNVVLTKVRRNVVLKKLHSVA
jgi:hypothetical protein